MTGTETGAVLDGQWRVGAVTITSISEAETPGIPPELFFPTGSAAEVAAEQWLIPTWAAADGTIGMRVQALVVDTADMRILVDPCVGNGKRRMLPFWNELATPFFERLTAGGFAADSIDVVVHTHLHADHVGWDTHLVDGEWIPTFTSARHLYTQDELDYWMAAEQRQLEDVYADSVGPIFDAGLADIVAVDAEIAPGIRLTPTPGHTPGHVSMLIESNGEHAVISGDLIHHPVQCAYPEWNEIGDWSTATAEVTRTAFLDTHARSGALVIGTHFPALPAGRIRVGGRRYRFVPE